MKSARQNKIIELVNNFEISTQEELKDRLIDEGFNATQATVSRDIKELKLTKGPANSGKQKYYSNIIKKNALPDDKYIRVFSDGCISMDLAMNILVIKTVSGMAMAVCAALDAMDFSEVVGSIAGDDTIMCAVRSIEEAKQLMFKLKKILENRF